MQLQNKNSLSLADLLALAEKERNQVDDLSYAKENVFCRCRFSVNGKCALKSCCCIAERVQAHACSFVEAMNDCFSNVNDHVFQYRLRLATEQFKEVQTCFLTADHKKRFYDALNTYKNKSNMFVAQLYILTANRELWEEVKPYIVMNGVTYGVVRFHDMTPNEYIYFMTAYDFANGTAHLTIEDISNDEVVDFDAFCVICCAVVMSVYGLEVLKLGEPRNKKDNGKNEGKGYGAE